MQNHSDSGTLGFGFCPHSDMDVSCQQKQSIKAEKYGIKVCSFFKFVVCLQY